METLNCQGLSCPQPVLRSKDFIEANPQTLAFTVVVDNAAAAQNVVRFVESQGFDASLEQNDNDFEIKAERSEEARSESVTTEPATSSEKTLVLIPKNTMGSGDDVLAQGVSIPVCGTCLTHFNLLDQKRVGETTNMLDIVTSMQLADKVISV